MDSAQHRLIITTSAASNEEWFCTIAGLQGHDF